MPTERGRVVEVRLRTNAASAELAADLAAIEPRQRAERLRMLATLGLAMLRDGAPVPQPVAEVLPDGSQEPAELSDRKARLLACLQW